MRADVIIKFKQGKRKLELCREFDLPFLPPEKFLFLSGDFEFIVVTSLYALDYGRLCVVTKRVTLANDDDLDVIEKKMHGEGWRIDP